MEKTLKKVLAYLHENCGFDYSGYRMTMVERRTRQRTLATKCKDVDGYFHYLQNTPNELDKLINALTINVSRFFRNPLTFDYLADQILPPVFQKKTCLSQALRVWSTGCSMGEEAYSIAILINEYLEKQKFNPVVHIFATDIDTAILKKARAGVYPFDRIKNVPYGLLKKYFFQKEDFFHLLPEIRKMVSFSRHDILNKNNYAPRESIFGGFDMVFCRNLLIYFTPDHQDKIFDRLYHAITEQGYLILGEAEIPSKKFQNYFKKVTSCSHIYQKK